VRSVHDSRNKIRQSCEWLRRRLIKQPPEEPHGRKTWRNILNTHPQPRCCHVLLSHGKRDTNPAKIQTLMKNIHVSILKTYGCWIMYLKQDKITRHLTIWKQVSGYDRVRIHTRSLKIWQRALVITNCAHCSMYAILATQAAMLGPGSGQNMAEHGHVINNAGTPQKFRLNCRENHCWNHACR